MVLMRRLYLLIVSGGAIISRSTRRVKPFTTNYFNNTIGNSRSYRPENNKNGKESEFSCGVPFQLTGFDIFLTHTTISGVKNLIKS